MADEKRRELSEDSKQPESEERRSEKDLKDLDITDEVGGALKGGKPLAPPAPN